MEQEPRMRPVLGERHCERVLAETERADLPWRRHYEDYQSGGWWTTTLIGRSGNAADGEVVDVPNPVETTVLVQMPILREFITKLGLRVMTARLARLDPGAALWEHRDYQDLDPRHRCRLQVPLVTSPEALFVMAGHRYSMPAGSLILFNPKLSHAACNRGVRPRVHLILDVYQDEALLHLLADCESVPAIALPPLSEETVRERVADGRSKDPKASGAGVPPKGLRVWEREALELLFDYAIPEGSVYVALERACHNADDHERARFWADRRSLVLAEAAHVRAEGR